jgi:hypothetical protein
MQSTGTRLISELKRQVLETMRGIKECQPDQMGVTYRTIQDLAGLALNLPKQDGWLTWSILASLNQDNFVNVEKRGRYLYWRLSNCSSS